MKILIGPISLHGFVSIERGRLENPGIGGSEFHSLALALSLSVQHDVTVWVESGNLSISGVKVTSRIDSGEPYDLQIAYTSKAHRQTIDELPLIAISHHPFDSHIKDLPGRTRVVVNVGAYQLRTNQSYARKARVKQVWLPIFFGEPRIEQAVRASDFRVGHLSSLHPSKGFHDVLAGWMKYSTKGGAGRLQVIGGQSLYGLDESHEVIPTSRDYGSRLMRLMGGSLHPTVSFLGRRIGVGDLVSKWHVAVLNPKAFGESVNISLADCWREGTPVIAGNRFGQRDSMRLTPGLAASSPRRIAHLLGQLNQDPEMLEEYQAMSKSAYEILYARGRESKSRWIELVADLLADPKISEFAGLDIGRSTPSLRLQLFVDGSMVRAQRVASRVLLILARHKKR
jgi:hypothetical protein